MNPLHQKIEEAISYARAIGDNDTVRILEVLVDAHKNDYVEALKGRCQNEYIVHAMSRDLNELGIEE